MGLSRLLLFQMIFAPGAGEATAIERYITALSDPSHKIRLQAISQMGDLENIHAGDPLLERLENDPHYTVRAAAAHALAKLAFWPALPLLFRHQGGDPEGFVREEAARAISTFAREDVLSRIPTLYRAADSIARTEIVRYVLTGQWRSMERFVVQSLGDAPHILPLVSEALKGKPRDYRQHIYEEAANHRNVGVRLASIKLISAERDKDAADLVIRVFWRQLEEGDVRRASREALVGLREHIDIDAVLQKSRPNREKYERARALRLLGIIGGERARKRLMATLADTDLYLVGTSVMALKDLADVSAVAPLEKMMTNPRYQRIQIHIRGALRVLRARRDKKL